MASKAQVSSIEALDGFRSRLIVFLEKASAATDDVADDLMRMRVWVQSDQRMHWEAQLRRRTRALEEAQAELFSAQIRNLRESTSTRQLNVTRAKRSVQEAQDKLAALRHWNRHFDGEVAPLLKQVEKLRTTLTTDLRQAVALLTHAVEILDAYSGRTTLPDPAANTPAASNAPEAPPS